MTSSNTPNKRLFVAGIPYAFNEGDLLRLFIQFGKVIDVHVLRYRYRSRGMGYVEFENLDDAITAQQKLRNRPIGDNRTIIVDFAQPDTKSKEEHRPLTRHHSHPRPSHRQ